MKIKYIVFAILFCFVSSSALAWSFPWQKKDIKPRVETPVSETTPSEPTPETKYWCKETPESISHLARDVYCCNEDLYIQSYGPHTGPDTPPLYTKENVEICLNQNLSRIVGATWELRNIYNNNRDIFDSRGTLTNRAMWVGNSSGGDIDDRIERVIAIIDYAIGLYEETHNQIIDLLIR